LGIAFSDVKEKVAVFKNNNIIYKDFPGFLSFIKMEIDKNIHIYNGENNSKLKAPK